MNIAELVKTIISQLTSATTVSKGSSKSQPSPLLEVELISPPPILDNGYIIWAKGQANPISKHFNSKEMSCHCSYPECIEQRISQDLIQRIEKIREEVGQPLIITSAFRCPAWQAHLADIKVNTDVAQFSQHELGNAVDILPKDGKDILTTFEVICSKHFDSIGLSDKFLHCDLRKGYRRWKY